MNTETCITTPIRSVKGSNATGADEDIAIWQKRDRIATNGWRCAVRAEG